MPRMATTGERALGHPIVGEIEYAPSQVTASLNRGTPLVAEYLEEGLEAHGYSDDED